jgi:hypothetical protein
MKFKTTVYLLLAVCVFGALIWLVDRKAEWQELWQRPIETVLDTRVDEITAFTVKKGDMKLRCIKMEETWFIESPIRARANTGVVEKLLSMLESLPKGDVVSQQQREKRSLSIEDYGLLKPRAEYVLMDRLGRQRMLVGHDSPVGDQVYIKLQSSDDVIAVNRSVFDLIPAGVKEIRDAAVLSGETAMTSKLEIRQTGVGFIQLVKDAGVWVIRQPVQARADAGKVQQMLDSLYALRVDEFVWDPVLGDSDGGDASVNGKPDARSREEMYQLAPDVASVRIAVWVGGDESGQELVLGKAVEEGAGIYAKKRDVDSVYAVDKSIFDVFSVAVNDLRSKALFGNRPEDVRSMIFEKGDKKLVLAKEPGKGWWVTEPVQWKADETVVSDALRDITRLTAEVFLGAKDNDPVVMGLSPPACRILLSNKYAPAKKDDTDAGDDKSNGAEAEAGVVDVLLIGGSVKGKPSAYGKFGNEELFFEMPSKPVAAIVENAVDPLVYRDRTMLSVNPQNVKKLTLQKNGVEQTIVLSDAGKWQVGGSPTNTPSLEIDHSTINDILFHVANLRALRIDAHNPKTKVPYGLDPAGMVLTLGLQGEKGIQKSILFGFLSKTDGVYSMVQGQDVVFVLKNGIVNSLTKSFVKPRPSSDEKKKK